MTVVPNRVAAGTTGNELSFAFTADSAPLKGTTLVDVPRGWSKPQQTDPAAPGYVELQAAGCVGTRIAAISSRRIVIATQCPRRHLFRLLYHKAAAPLLSADGFVFLTQTRPAGAPEEDAVPAARPVEAAGRPRSRRRAAGLFMTVTSVATAGVPFGATVRTVDQFGNNAADYAGTVTLDEQRPIGDAAGAVRLRREGRLAAHVHGVVLRTPGTQTMTATDSNGFTIQSPPITVSSS